MSLRGCDPYLALTLERLLNQVYKSFEIILVIDSREDPAWKVAEQIRSKHDQDGLFRIFELQDPSSTCGLKCSSLIQATDQIASDSEFVVLIDADVVPHPNWLRDVVRPLADPRVGVVTGSQWFSPQSTDGGSLLRSIWNSGAMVASAINRNPWAGTCAMRVSDLQRSGLIEKWKTSVVDDGPIKPAFARLGLSVFFEPSLIMVNRDQCSTEFAGRYVTRMLTWSRIFEKTFINTVVHAVAMVGLLVAAFVVLAAAVVQQNRWATLLMGTSILLSNLIMFAGFGAIQQSVRDAISHRPDHDAIATMSWAKAMRVFALIPVCQFAHAVWTFKAIVARQANWRNITYRLHRQQRVEMVAYQPYQLDESRTVASKASI
jgi:glycosyltransferase involved in cell wall biosynthesis